MHQSVLDFGQANLTAAEVKGKRVLEVGSLNVNGSLRSYIESLEPAEYLGLDLQDGPGVDIEFNVCDPGSCLIEFRGPGLQGYCLVICTEMLEHARDWRMAIDFMKRSVEIGGIILLTTRSIGFARHHEYPGDYWRFSLEDMRHIFSDFIIEKLDPDPGGSGGGPGVFLKARKPAEWGGRELESIEVYSMENEPA